MDSMGKIFRYFDHVIFYVATNDPRCVPRSTKEVYHFGYGWNHSPWSQIQSERTEEKVRFFVAGIWGPWVNWSDIFLTHGKKKHARWFKPWPFDSPVGGNDSPFKWSLNHPKKVTIAELPGGWVPLWPKTWGTSQDPPRSKKTKAKLVRLSQCNSTVLSIFMVSCPKSVHGCRLYLHTWMVDFLWLSRREIYQSHGLFGCVHLGGRVAKDEQRPVIVYTTVSRI